MKKLLPNYLTTAPKAALLGLMGLIVSGVAQAQDEGLQELEIVKVAGSNIPLAIDESFAPVASYTKDDLLISGANTPVEGLRQLPSYVGGTATEQDSNRGTGAAFVNLRGLSSTSTLTLINGRPAYSFEDVNLLPLSPINRVDIVKDGAATTYGADAIAGAVDFQMASVPPERANTRLLYGNTTDKDAGVTSASFLTGLTSDTGKTRIVLAGEWYKRNDIYSRDRSRSENADLRDLGGDNGGSPTVPGIIEFNSSWVDSNLGPRDTAQQPSGTRVILVDGEDSASGVGDIRRFTNDDFFNFRVFTPAIPGQEKHSFWGSVEHDLGNQITGFAEFLYSRIKTSNALAPSPFAVFSSDWIGGTEGVDYAVSPYNELFGSGASEIRFARYRSIELGNRLTAFDKEAFRVLGGLRGKIGDNWNWEAAAMRIEATTVEKNSGFPSNQLLLLEVASGAFNPYARQFSTGSATINGTTYNWDNEAALLRAGVGDQIVDKEQLDYADLVLNGELFDLPAGKVDVALGLEWSDETVSSKPGPLYATGDALGLNSSSPFSAESTVVSTYAETIVPILGKDSDIPMVHNLELNAAIRYGEYSYSGEVAGNSVEPDFNSTDYKIGLRYQPIEDLTIRSTISTAFRAPSVGELFTPPGDSFPTLSDPLGFTSDPQVQVSVGGSADLQPEESDNLTIGFAYSPKEVSGLFISVDYYSIEKTGVIVFDSSQLILEANANGQGTGFPQVVSGVVTTDPNAPFADRITRNSDGSLSNVQTSVVAGAVNIASNEVEGYDILVSYELPTEAMGTYTFTANFNRFTKWDVIRAPGQPAESWLGTFVDQASDELSPGSIPKWKGFVNVVWKNGPWTASGTVNYIDSFSEDPNFIVDSSIADETIDSWTTFDAQVSYRFDDSFNSWLANTTVTIGGENLFDKEPPLALGAFNDNYDTTLHSIRGQYLYVSLSKDW